MPETEQRQALRENFIEAFIRDLIINSYDPKKAAEDLTEMKKELEKTNAMPMVNFSEKITHEAAFPENTKLPMPQMQKQPPQRFQKNFQLTEPRQHPSPGRIPLNSPIPLPQTYQPTKLRPGQKPETINLGKLAGILVDPSVFSVECPGPYKNLLVNRSGSIQTSAVALTNEEISAIMHNISNQTRIPLTGGIFRAAVQDLVVTAVVSDFVGTRFVIQKRNPFTRY